MSAIAQPGRIAAARTARAHHGWWWKTLLTGVLIWAATAAVTAITRNSNLVPTLILIGSFLIPFCVVLFAVERVTGTVSTLRLVLAFFVGGTFGVLGASLLEVELAHSAWLYGLVGLIEEAIKGVLLVIFGWRVLPKTAAQGALIGATVGAGFAAFESAGYAFNSALSDHGIDLIALLQTEVIRAVLAPLGHVLWTAILGAVIFGSARGAARLRWSWWIPVVFIAVSVLHALWDMTPTAASAIAIRLTEILLGSYAGSIPTHLAVDVATMISLVLSVALLLTISAIGILALWVGLRTLRRDQTRTTPIVPAL